MKTTKLIIGIISLVLFAVVIFQSCAVGIGNAMAESKEASGGAGVFVALCMLTAGIIAIATRKGKAGGFVSGGFYAFGGLIGIANVGSYADLKIWSVLSLLFAATFIIGSIFIKKPKKDDKAQQAE